MKKDLTTFPQRISLIALGAILCFILLEAGLLLGGITLLSLQELRNRISLSQKKEYVILCIGESTTQNQYPRFLEKMLNSAGTGVRFSVIDKGRGGIYASIIADELTLHLDAYHPDMVIAMVGINDGGTHLPYESPSLSWPQRFLRSLKTYKLARLLLLHLDAKIKAIPQTSRSVAEGYGENFGQDITGTEEEILKERAMLNPKEEKYYLELSQFYRGHNRFQEAEAVIGQVLAFNPLSDHAYIELGIVSLHQEKLREAEEAFKRAMEINPGNSYAFFELGDFYRSQNRFHEAKNLLEQAAALGFLNEALYISLAEVYLQDGSISLAQEACHKALSFYPGNEKMYGLCARVYSSAGEHKHAQEYFKKALTLRESRYLPSVVNSYRKIRGILKERNIPLVCVQYPMRSLEPLKKIFDDERGVVFVDNEAAFKEAVEKEGYDAYFIDMFAGDFGHCTTKGNLLLAENIARAILKELCR